MAKTRNLELVLDLFSSCSVGSSMTRDKHWFPSSSNLLLGRGWSVHHFYFPKNRHVVSKWRHSNTYTSCYDDTLNDDSHVTYVHKPCVCVAPRSLRTCTPRPDKHVDLRHQVTRVPKKIAPVFTTPLHGVFFIFFPRQWTASQVLKSICRVTTSCMALVRENVAATLSRVKKWKVYYGSN